MATAIMDFLTLTGTSFTFSSLADLIPVILELVTGVFLVSGFFGIIGKLMDIILDITRWK